ncbi:hypothetical protein [Rubrivirga sp. IMCC45206]|uniref:hypothetical protein n=1 Tax=Rubrivirga sp. IMCC45206 TaxID=3391614 RepID=UPI0039902F05
MANIPVERSAGTPWWLWLLGALLLGALLWFLIGAFSDDDDVDDAYVDDTEMVEDVDPVVVAGDMDADAGMALDMSNLYVTRVTGDRTFFVAASDDPNAAETLVILNEEASAAPGIEGQVDINPGQRVSLAGADYGALGDMDLLNMGIPDADLNAMTSDTNVIRVDGDEVEILEADMENVEAGE